MKYSVIVPVYNTEKYIAECIESVLAQSYPDWELWLIDDESIDNSASICESYMKKDARIHLIHKNNEGPLEARKTGICYSGGEYCLFLDSDDYWDEKLLYEVNHLVQQEDADVIIFNMMHLYKSSLVQDPSIITETETNITSQEMITKMLHDTRLGSMAMKAVKREKLLRINGLIKTESCQGEDLYQSMALMCYCQKVSILDKHLYYYRQRKTSSVHGEEYGKIKQHFQVRRKIQELLQQFGKLNDENYKLLVQSSLIYIAECIFNQNNFRNSWKQKREILALELTNNNLAKILKYRKQSKLIFYQNIRLCLYEKKFFSMLIALDILLMFIKKILSKIKKQVMFE